jgi:hypothetical protein
MCKPQDRTWLMITLGMPAMTAVRPLREINGAFAVAHFSPMHVHRRSKTADNRTPPHRRHPQQNARGFRAANTSPENTPLPLLLNSSE